MSKEKHKMQERTWPQQQPEVKTIVQKLRGWFSVRGQSGGVHYIRVSSVEAWNDNMIEFSVGGVIRLLPVDMTADEICRVMREASDDKGN